MICLVYFSPYFPSPSTYKKENLTPQAFVLLFLQPILGDPGGVSRAGLKGATKVFHLCLKTFVAPFLPARLTVPGSPRMLTAKHGERKMYVPLMCSPSACCDSNTNKRLFAVYEHEKSQPWHKPLI